MAPGAHPSENRGRRWAGRQTRATGDVECAIVWDPVQHVSLLSSDPLLLSSLTLLDLTSILKTCRSPGFFIESITSSNSLLMTLNHYLRNRLPQSNRHPNTLLLLCPSPPVLKPHSHPSPLSLFHPNPNPSAHLQSLLHLLLVTRPRPLLVHHPNLTIHRVRNICRTPHLDLVPPIHSVATIPSIPRLLSLRLIQRLNSLVLRLQPIHILSPTTRPHAQDLHCLPKNLYLPFNPLKPLSPVSPTAPTRRPSPHQESRDPSELYRLKKWKNLTSSIVHRIRYPINLSLHLPPSRCLVRSRPMCQPRYAQVPPARLPSIPSTTVPTDVPRSVAHHPWQMAMVPQLAPLWLAQVEILD